MRARRLLPAFVALALLGTVGCAGMQGGRKPGLIGVIDVPRILDEFEGFKASRKDLEAARKDIEKENKTRTAELQKQAEDFQRTGKMLSEAKQKEKIQELQRLQADLQEWQQEKSKELQDREEGMVKRLEADVRKVLEKIGADGTYSFVVRRDIFLYVEKSSVDLTDRVLEELRRAAKDAAKPAPSEK